MDIYLHQNGVQAGPFTEEQVRDMVGVGAVSPKDFAWRDGLPEWRPLDEVISMSAPPPPPPPEPPEPELAPPVSRDFSALPQKEPQSSGLGLAAAVIGILLIVALAGWAVEKTRKRNEQKEAQVQKLQQAEQDLVSGVRKALDDPKTAPAAMQKQVDAYSQQLGGAASSLEGRDKRIAQAAQHFIQLVSDKMRKYNSAHDALVKDGFLKAEGINTRDDLQHRRQLVQALDDVNNDVIDFYKNAMTIYRDELQKQNVGDDQDVEEALRQVEKQGTIENALQIRELEADLLAQGNKVLDLYDQEWGKWKLAGEGKVLFDNPAAATAYNSAMEVIRGDAAKQMTIEKQILQKTEAVIQSQTQPK